MSRSPATLRGQCLCHAVEYSVPDEFLYALNCHCSDCRRATGAAFKSFAGIESAKLNVVRGAGQLLRYGQSELACDEHCGACGSFLFSIVKEGQIAHVTLGTLIDTPSIRPSAHIFVGSKAAWFEITDALPQYEGHAP